MIQPHDTICLSLYKRVFPRWGESYRPLVGDELMSASATDGSYVHMLAKALGTDASHIGSRAGGSDAAGCRLGWVPRAWHGKDKGRCRRVRGGAS